MDRHFGRLLPKGKPGQIIAQYFASTIRSVHTGAPKSWGLTARDSFIRLNVGTPEVLTLREGTLRVCVLRHLVPPSVLAAPNLYVFEPDAGADADVYPSVRGSLLLVVDDLGLRGLNRVLSEAQQSHLAFARAAGTTSINPMTKKSHTPEAVDELAAILGIGLPQPRYFSAGTA